MNNLKVGDKLECKHDHFYVYDKDFTVGKSYVNVIIDIYKTSIRLKIKDNVLKVINDRGEEQSFLFSTYHLWFYTKQEMRQLKLERLLNV